MAVTTCAELINMTRRFVRDWPDQDVLTASLSSTASVVSIADGTIYSKNWQLEFDQETVTTAAAGSGTTVAVRRAARGSTAASHATGTVVLIRPHFSALEILDALNASLTEMYPKVYKPVLDTSLTTLANTFEYTVPNLDGVPIPYLSKIELKASGTSDYVEVRGWSVRRGATPKIQFRDVQETGATIRVHGFGPFAELAYPDSLSAQFPLNLVKALPVGAASYLLASGEAGRVRADVLATDDREAANRTGSSMSAANALYNRFLRMVANGAPGPLPPHVTPTF